SGCIRLTKLLFYDLHAFYPAVLVAEDRCRIVEEAEDDAFLLRVMELFQTGRSLLLTSSVYDIYFFRAKTFRCSGCVHGNIAGTHDSYSAAHLDRGRSLRELVSLHQVHTGQEFIGGIYAKQVLTRNI